MLIENGGDYNYDAFALTHEGEQLLRDVNASSIAFNGDASNMASLRPEADAIGELLQMLPNMRHCSIKDVAKRDHEYRFPAIGQGLLDYGAGDAGALNTQSSLSEACAGQSNVRR
nr:hypothetical protein [Pantoea sp.]